MLRGARERAEKTPSHGLTAESEKYLFSNYETRLLCEHDFLNSTPSGVQKRRGSCLVSDKNIEIGQSARFDQSRLSNLGGVSQKSFPGGLGTHELFHAGKLGVYVIDGAIQANPFRALKGPIGRKHFEAIFRYRTSQIRAALAQNSTSQNDLQALVKLQSGGDGQAWGDDG